MSADPTRPGTLSILDSMTGAVLITATAGLNPGALLVNPGAAHLFVIDQEPGTYLPDRGTVYFSPAGTGSVLELDARTGALLRATPLATSGGVRGAVLHDGRIDVFAGVWCGCWMRQLVHR